MASSAAKAAHEDQRRKMRELHARPKLVKVGKHYISPDDVGSIREVKDGLFIVDLKSRPNAEYPMWVPEKYIGNLLKYFELVGGEED